MPRFAKDNPDDSDATGQELRRVRNRELELKRARGEISCAECRRLKLKCDKKVPCSSCKRRGCQRICPTGVNNAAAAASGAGASTSFVFDASTSTSTSGSASTSTSTTAPASAAALASVSDSERVLQKLTAMSERIRALEDALQIESAARAHAVASADLAQTQMQMLQQGVVPSTSTSTAISAMSGCASPSVHPLLSSDLLAIKQSIDTYVPKDKGDDEEETLMNAFGTLSISDGQTMRFLGASATEQLLLMEVFEKNATPTLHTSTTQSFSPAIEQLSALWPFAPLHLPTSVLSGQLVAQLPPIERVTALYEAYFTNLSWFLAPVDRAQVVDELVPQFYPRPSRRPVDPAAMRPEMLHDLALLFAVFACGAVADLTLPPNNEEGSRFNEMSRAALGLRSVFDGSSLSACQAIFLLGSYEIYAARKTSQETSWKMMSFALGLSASIGLHRDPERWNLGPKLVDRRRRCFWEIYIIDIWKSLGTGRPSLFSPNFIDCEFPPDHGAIVEDDGNVVQSVWQWRYRFARDVLPHLVDRLCSARPLKYSEILELDRRVRDFDTHPYLRRTVPKRNLGADPEFFGMHPLVSAWYKEMSLLYIHRNFFARAIMDHPKDPMRSPFAPSFLSTYRSASALLKIIRESYKGLALVLFRMWPMWAQALSSAVILGSVVCRAPTLSFASTAFSELEQAMDLFEGASAHPVVNHGLPLLRRLRNKAHFALSNSRKLLTSQPSELVPKDAEGPVQDELLILRGATRLVQQHTLPPSIERAPGARTEVQTTYSEMAKEYLGTAWPGKVKAQKDGASPASTESSGADGSRSASVVVVSGDEQPVGDNANAAPPTSPEQSGSASARPATATGAGVGSASGSEGGGGPEKSTVSSDLFTNAIMFRLFPGQHVRAPSSSGDGSSPTAGPAGAGGASHDVQNRHKSIFHVENYHQHQNQNHTQNHTAERQNQNVNAQNSQHDIARAWLAQVEQDRAVAIVEQLAKQQNAALGQEPEVFHHPAEPLQSHSTKFDSVGASAPYHQPQNYQSWPWPPTASMMSAMHGPLGDDQAQALTLELFQQAQAHAQSQASTPYSSTGGTHAGDTPNTDPIYDPAQFGDAQMYTMSDDVVAGAGAGIGMGPTLSAEDMDAIMSYHMSFTPIADHDASFSTGTEGAEAWHNFVQQGGFMDTEPTPEGWVFT